MAPRQSPPIPAAEKQQVTSSSLVASSLTGVCLRLRLDSSPSVDALQAVLSVIKGGRTVIETEAAVGVSRQPLHAWLAKYEAGGLEGLVDGSHRPLTSPQHHCTSEDGTVMQADIDLSEDEVQRRADADRREVDRRSRCRRPRGRKLASSIGR